MKKKAVQVLAIVSLFIILLTSAAVDCFATKTISNNQVKAVQTALNREGYKLEVDGKIGKNTRAALMKFQKAHKLPATGKADETTQKNWG